MYKFYYEKPDRRCSSGVRYWSMEFPTKAAGFKYASASGVDRFSYTEPGNSKIISCSRIF